MIAAVDLSADLGGVRDQGPRGTCLAFAATAAHEHARLGRRGGPRIALTEEVLYWAAKQVDGDRDPGTAPASMARALRDTGQPEAHLWPYDPERRDGGASYVPPPAALAPDVLRTASFREIATDLATLRGLVESGQVAILGLELWGQFFSSHDGVLETPPAEELLGVGHAVALVGFDDGPEQLLLRNSWGPRWGAGGHATLPYRAVAVVCVGAWVVEDDVDS